MQRVAIEANFTSEEEYFLFEEKSETRHELINGNLYEMSGISKYHNNIVLNLLMLFSKLLNQEQYMIAFESYKYRTPDRNFFYPDVMICETNSKRYYAEKPVLIAEVLSPSTRKFNLVDKFIQYQKAETLQYYLCIEPEQKVVIFYFKTSEGEWMTETFTNDNDEVALPHLAISFFVKDIYQSA